MQMTKPIIFNESSFKMLLHFTVSLRITSLLIIAMTLFVRTVKLYKQGLMSDVFVHFIYTHPLTILKPIAVFV